MGHSTSSGRNNETGRRVGNPDSVGFTNEGNGQWTLDIAGWGGGQILDESDSRENEYGAAGGKLYSARAWDNDYQMTGEDRYFGSLNEAKQYIRDELYSAFRRSTQAALERGRQRT